METRPSKFPNGNIFPFTLALVMVTGFLLFIGKIVWHDPQDLDLLKTLSAIFLGPIGTILGFYFGARPAEKLQQRVQDLVEANKDMLREVEQRKNELQTKAGAATEALQRAIAEKETVLNQLEKLRALLK
jgi:hypothetical protein